MNPNEIVHTAMGLCWHEWQNGTIHENTANHERRHCCSKCDARGSGHVHLAYLNPDYSQPEHIGKVYAWLRETVVGNVTRSWQFNKWLERRGKKAMTFRRWFCKEPDTQIEVLSEWITEG